MSDSGRETYAWRDDVIAASNRRKRVLDAAPEMLDLLRDHLEMRSMTNGHAELCRRTEALISRIEGTP